MISVFRRNLCLQELVGIRLYPALYKSLFGYFHRPPSRFDAYHMSRAGSQGRNTPFAAATLEIQHPGVLNNSRLPAMITLRRSRRRLSAKRYVSSGSSETGGSVFAVPVPRTETGGQSRPTVTLASFCAEFQLAAKTRHPLLVARIALSLNRAPNDPVRFIVLNAHKFDDARQRPRIVGGYFFIIHHVRLMLLASNHRRQLSFCASSLSRERAIKLRSYVTDGICCILPCRHDVNTPAATLWPAKRLGPLCPGAQCRSSLPERAYPASAANRGAPVRSAGNVI